MKEIKPTPYFYKNFRLYQPDKKCSACGQIVKSKRPNVYFFLVGVTKKGLLKVKASNKKTVYSYHPSFFKGY